MGVVKLWLTVKCKSVVTSKAPNSRPHLPHPRHRYSFEGQKFVLWNRSAGQISWFCGNVVDEPHAGLLLGLMDPRSLWTLCRTCLISWTLQPIYPSPLDSSSNHSMGFPQPEAKLSSCRKTSLSHRTMCRSDLSHLNWPCISFPFSSWTSSPSSKSPLDPRCLNLCTCFTHF